jgi:hypothetical protein
MEWHQRVSKKVFVVSAERKAPEGIRFHLNNKGISIFYPEFHLRYFGQFGPK